MKKEIKDQKVNNHNFKDLPIEKKSGIIVILIELIVFLCLCPLACINRIDLALGWLLGGIIAILCYGTLIVSLNKVIEINSTKPTTTALSVMSFGLRFILYAVGLAISGICTFQPQWFGGFNLFNFWTTFVAYLPIYFVLVIVGLAQNSGSNDTNLDKNTILNNEEED